MGFKPSLNHPVFELSEKTIKKHISLLGGEDITLGTPQLV